MKKGTIGATIGIASALVISVILLACYGVFNLIGIAVICIELGLTGYLIEVTL